VFSGTLSSRVSCTDTRMILVGEDRVYEWTRGPANSG
jgi:hypothetical protein